MKCIVCNLEGQMWRDLHAEGPYCTTHYAILKKGEQASDESKSMFAVHEEKPLPSERDQAVIDEKEKRRQAFLAKHPEYKPN